MQTSLNYSTTHISQQLVDEICGALKNLDYGSVELYVVNGNVTQITKRQIKKTNSTETRYQTQKQ